MASGEFKWYGQGLFNVCKGNIDLSSDVLKVLMTTSVYTPNQATDSTLADVSGEVSGVGYTAGGAEITKSLTHDTGGSQVKLVVDDVIWISSTVADARVAVVYKDSGNPETSYLIGYSVFSQNLSSDAGNFKLDFDNVAGILRVDYS